jgi:hypothetical protein
LRDPMSFYGLVMVFAVLVISFYLLALMSEANSLSWIAAAYAAVAHSIGSGFAMPVATR